LGCEEFRTCPASSSTGLRTRILHLAEGSSPFLIEGTSAASLQMASASSDRRAQEDLQSALFLSPGNHQ
jgi:hypothetical protein